MDYDWTLGQHLLGRQLSPSTVVILPDTWMDRHQSLITNSSQPLCRPRLLQHLLVHSMSTRDLGSDSARQHHPHVILRGRHPTRAYLLLSMVHALTTSIISPVITTSTWTRLPPHHPTLVDRPIPNANSTASLQSPPTRTRTHIPNPNLLPLIHLER
jgi:hypothetical protein